MWSRTIVAAVALAALAAPHGVRAQEREWEEDYSNAGTDYDVSVDLNVSGGVSFDTFQGALSPYGDWVVAGSYGRVWRPRVVAGWRPYYYGRWEWTNEGWLWASDEPWGWATYHYGRWAFDPYFGWIWVPGYEWAPAWVSWRVSGDVIGWAPLAPGLSVYVTSYPFVDFWWTFVPCAQFVSVPVYSVAYAPSYSRRWYYATAPAPARPAPRGFAGRPAPSPSPAWGGPAPRLVEQRIGRPLVPSRIVAAPSPGARARAGEVPVFRPETRPAPGRSAPGVGPGPVAAPGRGDAPERWAPPGNGRGPGPVPAPGRGGAPERWSPPPAGNGRGPGPVPAPGRGGAPERWSPQPPASGGRPGAASAPGGGAPPRAAPPASAPPQRGGGGGSGRGRGEEHSRVR